MTAEVIMVGNVAILASIKRLYERGDITLEQYAGCLRRYADDKDRT